MVLISYCAVPAATGYNGAVSRPLIPSTSLKFRNSQAMYAVLLQVIRLYPLYEDDAVPEGPIVQHLQPLVHKLLQHGVADLQCLCVNADIIPRPELLGKLPLRHLEIRIGRRSRAQLKDIMAALGQCTTLEHLFISARGLYTVSLPDLCLYKASYLKNVILQACFPEGRLCLPPGCQLRLDVEGNFSCWEHKWQSENGRELLGCIPALCMGSRYSYGDPYHMKVLSHFHHFKVLQYLQLMNMPELTDLAMLQGIPHINVRLSHCQSSLLHSAGSWESLQIESYSGYGINFANIEAFVRDNPKYLLETDKAAKEWRSMRSALEAASKKLGVACFTNKSGSYYKRISTSRSLAESTTISLRCRESWPLANHLVNVDDFWPKQSHLASIAPIPKTDVLGCKCRLSNQVATEQSIGQEGHACQMVSWGCLLVIACILLFCMVVLAIVGGYLYLE